MLIVCDVGPAALFATIALLEIILFLVTKTIAVELQWHLYNLCNYVQLI